MPVHPICRALLAAAAVSVTASAAAAQGIRVTKDAPPTAPNAPAARPAAAAQTDPRVGLRGGITDAAEAARGMRLVAHQARPQGFVDPADPGSFSFANADLAFRDNLVFQGGYNGVQVWDVSTPTSPTLRATIVCPGGQGDVSVYRNLLFMSVEETRGRIDCGNQGVADTVSAERFRGVRIFDITDLQHAKQVAFVQTCRGSHTHTLVTSPNDPANVYVYVSGTGVPRKAAELAGCSAAAPEEDPNTSLFRIEVIRVPLAAPQDARIVSTPRVFAVGSQIAGLQKKDTTDTTHTLSETSRCHDITAYSALGLAAGACAGNGLILDIRDPVNPKRIAEASDPNFSFWHSATFNNDGTTVLFSDEWGGGTQPRCRATDRPQWGADAIYRYTGGKLQPAGYYKLPAAQTDVENCVAHNGSLVPVPGRDIMVQAWYQGGVSVFDFTDPAHVKEIAFFDRGPFNPEKLTLAGYWSAYWYNGRIYGSEIGRGFDVFELQPSENLSQHEIDAAKLVQMSVFNPQDQPKLTWPASFVVARAYIDQLERGRGLAGARVTAITRALDRAEGLQGAARSDALTQLAAQLDRDASGAADAARVRKLADAVRQLAGSAR